MIANDVDLYICILKFVIFLRNPMRNYSGQFDLLVHSSLLGHIDMSIIKTYL